MNFEAAHFLVPEGAYSMNHLIDFPLIDILSY